MTLKQRWIILCLLAFSVIAGIAYGLSATSSDWKATLRNYRAIGPYTYGTILTKSDSTVVSCRGLYVGGTGNLNVVTLGGDTVLLTAIPTGVFVPVAVTKLMSTSTTATLVACMN